MFGFNKDKRPPEISINQAIDIISKTGKAVYSNVSFLGNKDFLNWHNSHYWIAISGCIPAYSYFVFNEYVRNFKNGLKGFSPAQQRYFNLLEDNLFYLCRISEPEMPGVQISKCLPLAVDREEVCNAYQISESNYVKWKRFLE